MPDSDVKPSFQQADSDSRHYSKKSRCPRCKTYTLESVSRRGILDHAVKALKLRPMRCYTCEKRCYIPKKSSSVRAPKTRGLK